MPRLSFDEIAGEAAPPIAEQLVSPNALRQRRYRERKTLQRNGDAGISLDQAAPASNTNDDGLDIPESLQRAP